MNQHRKSWLAEKQSSVLYKALAAKEKDPVFSALFLKLGDSAQEQAGIWESKMQADQESVPNKVPLGMRLQIILILINAFGAKPIRTLLAAAKIRGLSVYSNVLPNHPLPLTMADVGQRHTGSAFGGNLRASVFGINDGMVSNAALIFGMAGASSMDNHIVILAGIAGLLAGAFSMAAGEYLSVRSQKELFEYQIGLEAEELKLYPEEEAAELALIFEARGLTREEAQTLSKRLISDPERALDTLAREELGLNPKELGSEYQAAFFSFCAFSLGAVIPLVPFFIAVGKNALIGSIAVTAVALFVTGAVLSLFTGRNAVVSGLRILVIGTAAAAMTYGVGTILGVSIS